MFFSSLEKKTQGDKTVKSTSNLTFSFPYRLLFVTAIFFVAAMALAWLFDYELDYRLRLMRAEIRAEFDSDIDKRLSLLQKQLIEQSAKIDSIPSMTEYIPEITVNIDLGALFEQPEEIPPPLKNNSDIDPKVLPPAPDKETVEVISQKQNKLTTPEKMVAAYFEFIRRDNPDLNESLAHELAWHYYNQETQYKLAHGLILAIVHTESEHKPRAVSKKDAHGLMQIRRDTGREFAGKLGYWEDSKAVKGSSKKHPSDVELVRVITEPFNNIRLGSRILDDYLLESNNLDEALKRYSGGDGQYPDKIRQFYCSFWSELV